MAAREVEHRGRNRQEHKRQEQKGGCEEKGSLKIREGRWANKTGEAAKGKEGTEMRSGEGIRAETVKAVCGLRF